MKKLLGVLLLLGTCAACKTAIPPPPVDWVEVPVEAQLDSGVADRDGIGTDLGNICVKFRTLGCPEGDPITPSITCYEHLAALQAANVPMPIQCLKDALLTVDAIRACGGSDQLRFRCLK